MNESSVQFIEPVQTDSPSRTTYLWCIRSRQPGIGRTGTPSVSSTCGSVRGGAGKNGRSTSSSAGRSSWLNAIRTCTPRAAASLIAPPDAVADLTRQAHVVECEVERPAGRPEPRHHALGHRLGGLTAVGVGTHVEHGRGQYPGR